MCVCVVYILHISISIYCRYILKISYSHMVSPPPNSQLILLSLRRNGFFICSNPSQTPKSLNFSDIIASVYFPYGNIFLSQC